MIHRRQSSPTRAAFTLVELLVVITIIVVLLALLTPALDTAIYQSELAVCGANQKAASTGVILYAMEHHRRYPHRIGPASQAGWQPTHIRNAAYDDRPRLKPYLALNDTLMDPLTAEVDIETVLPDTGVWVNYAMWWSFAYPGGKAMQRVGEKMSWGGERYDILLSDNDSFRVDPFVYTVHPDKAGVLSNEPHQDVNALIVAFRTTDSWWASIATWQRGPMDLNYTRTDGSVERLLDVGIAPETSGPADASKDPRMTRLPENNGREEIVQWWTQLPQK